MRSLNIRPLMQQDTGHVAELVTQHFGSDRVVSRGRLHQCHELPGFVALVEDSIVGLLHYDVRGLDLEVVTLISEVEGKGVGRRLLEAVIAYARDVGGVSRCWLITTNNNHNAINFYRHIGWHLKATHEGGVNEARKLKPEIPLVDDNGIPIEDELEFEYQL